jgi:hypothetical protein
VTPDEFIGALVRSSLAERRPVDDPRTIESMLAHGDLLVTAWVGRRPGAKCTLILLCAPAAMDDYPRLGVDRHAGAYVLAATAPWE